MCVRMMFFSRVEGRGRVSVFCYMCSIGIEHPAPGTAVLTPKVEFAELEERSALEPLFDKVKQRRFTLDRLDAVAVFVP